MSVGRWDRLRFMGERINSYSESERTGERGKEMTLSIASKAYRYLDTARRCFSERKKSRRI